MHGDNILGCRHVTQTVDIVGFDGPLVSFFGFTYTILLHSRRCHDDLFEPLADLAMPRIPSFGEAERVVPSLLPPQPQSFAMLGKQMVARAHPTAREYCLSEGKNGNSGHV